MLSITYYISDQRSAKYFAYLRIYLGSHGTLPEKGQLNNKSISNIRSFDGERTAVALRPFDRFHHGLLICLDNHGALSNSKNKLTLAEVQARELSAFRETDGEKPLLRSAEEKGYSAKVNGADATDFVLPKSVKSPCGQIRYSHYVSRTQILTLVLRTLAACLTKPRDSLAVAPVVVRRRSVQKVGTARDLDARGLALALLRTGFPNMW